MFWDDLVPPDLTPAICWRAGVRCAGPGPVYEDCAPVDLDLTGQLTTPDLAALRPVSLYSEGLKELGEDKSLYTVTASVHLAVVGGVPAEGPPVYTDAGEPEFQREHGIGPGCAQPGMSAPPPVRLLAAAAAAVHPELPATTSICEDDWSGAMTELGEATARLLRPSCFPKCVRDMEPDTPALDPLCDVVRIDYANDSRSTIPPCTEKGGAPVIPDGAPACFILHANEALDPVCAAEGYNLEVEVVTAQSESGLVRYQAGCIQSPNKAKDCPEL